MQIQALPVRMSDEQNLHEWNDLTFMHLCSRYEESIGDHLHVSLFSPSGGIQTLWKVTSEEHFLRFAAPSQGAPVTWY